MKKKTHARTRVELEQLEDEAGCLLAGGFLVDSTSVQPQEFSDLAPSMSPEDVGALLDSMGAKKLGPTTKVEQVVAVKR